MSSGSEAAPSAAGRADAAFGATATRRPSERTTFIEHDGERIVLIDLSYLCEPHADSLAAIRHAAAVIQEQPAQSVLTLTYVQGAHFNFEVAQAVWQLARRNRPHVIAGAVVGIAPGLQQELYHLVMRVSRRTLPAFDDLDRAKDWLVSQKRSKDGAAPADG